MRDGRMPLPGRRIRLQGFSLMELLVVISIIALLASMLMPAISMVRDAARSTRCQSNLHQIGLAVYAYAADTEMYPDVKVSNTVMWSQSLEPYVESEGDNKNSLANTKAKRGVLRSCPLWQYSSFYAQISTSNNIVANEQIGYGMNKNCFLPGTNAQPIFNGTPYRTATSSSITKPATRVMIGDSGSYFLDSTQPLYCYDFLRHRGRSNYVFYDGHVASLIGSDVVQSLIDPSKL